MWFLKLTVKYFICFVLTKLIVDSSYLNEPADKQIDLGCVHWLDRRVFVEFAD